MQAWTNNVASPYIISVSSTSGKKYTFTVTDATYFPSELWTHLKPLYTYYRLKTVVFKVMPVFQAKPQNTSTDVGAVDPVCYIDTPLMYRTAHTSAELAEYATAVDFLKMRADNDVRTFSMFRAFTVKCKPAIEMEAYESLANTAYIAKYGQWLSTASDDGTIYNGAHFCVDLSAVIGVDAGQSSADRYAQRWTIEPLLYWEFKDFKGNAPNL